MDAEDTLEPMRVGDAAPAGAMDVEMSTEYEDVSLASGYIYRSRHVVCRSAYKIHGALFASVQRVRSVYVHMRILNKLIAQNARLTVATLQVILPDSRRTRRNELRCAQLPLRAYVHATSLQAAAAHRVTHDPPSVRAQCAGEHGFAAVTRATQRA